MKSEGFIQILHYYRPILLIEVDVYVHTHTHREGEKNGGRKEGMEGGRERE